MEGSLEAFEVGSGRPTYADWTDRRMTLDTILDSNKTLTEAPMTRARTLLAATLLSLGASATAAADSSLEAVQFMTGAWGKDGVTVEFWLPPLRGLMVGVNREPSGSGMPFFENLRIEARGDGVYYVASPRGEGTTAFKLTESGPNRVVFENPEHDFPQKITYLRVGDRLEAEVVAMKDGEWDGFELSWTATDCASEPAETD